MDFGLTLPQGAQRDLQRDVIKVATEAEEAGFAGLWAYERRLFPLHPADGAYGVEGLAWDEYYSYCADPLTVLALAGAVTRRVRLGTSVLIAPLHDRLYPSRALTTLDQASGGRVTAGLGAGWSTDEFAASGRDFARCRAAGSGPRSSSSVSPTRCCAWTPPWSTRPCRSWRVTCTRPSAGSSGWSTPTRSRWRR
ncbi:MAG: LLM class flavin-dependent oxidoreductase [Actinobacteria bacterium]|nr:LLM class flavin-dependent oxidoreductase [Actinomycetota bacterium]